MNYKFKVGQLVSFTKKAIEINGGKALLKRNKGFNQWRIIKAINSKYAPVQTLHIAAVRPEYPDAMFVVSCSDVEMAKHVESNIGTINIHFADKTTRKIRIAWSK